MRQISKFEKAARTNDWDRIGIKEYRAVKRKQTKGDSKLKPRLVETLEQEQAVV